MVLNMNDDIVAPHSRWGDVPTEALLAANISVLASNDKIGWLLAEDKNDAGGHDYFIQGHPEYDKYDLDAEYRRDLASGHKLPEHYYLSDDPTKVPSMRVGDRCPGPAFKLDSGHIQAFLIKPRG